MDESKLLKRSLLVICFLLLAAQSVLAGAPEGNPGSLEGQMQMNLSFALRDQGYDYTGEYSDELISRRQCISAFLWDNRDWLVDTDFPESRNVDAVICILHKMGYPEFDRYLYTDVVIDWCNQTVEKP